MKLLSPRLAALFVLLSLAASLLAACSGDSQAAVAAPAIMTLPTALVRPATRGGTAVVPAGMPQLANASAPTPTFLPIPTPLPQPPTPTTQPTGPGGLAFPLKTAKLDFGVAAHLFYTDRDTPLQSARDAGFGWVRQQIHWSDQEGPAGSYLWGELDDIVASINAHGLKLLISIVSAPTFYTANGGHGLPSDPNSMGDFVAALAEHYQGRVQAIEIWNEQNLAIENG